MGAAWRRGTADGVWLTWFALAAGAATLALRLAAADFRINLDEEIYFLIARNWANGGLPYRDLFDHKPPAVYLVYRLASLEGAELAYVRVAAALLLAASCWSLTGVLRQLGLAAPAAAFVAALLFLAVTLDRGLGTNTEHFYLPLLMFVLAALFRLDRAPVGSRVAAVAAAAAAVQVKYTCVLDLLGIFLFWLAARSGSDAAVRTALRLLVSTAAATLILFAAWAAYFESRWTWIEAFHAVFTANLRHAVLDPDGGGDFGRFLGYAAAVLGVAVVAGPPEVFGRGRMWAGAAAYLLLALLQGAATGLNYYHYFIPAFVPVVLLVAAARPRFGGTRAVLAAAIATALLAVTAFHWQRWRDEQFPAETLYGADGLCSAAHAFPQDTYVLSGALDVYRRCEIAPADRFLLPGFYRSPRFASLSGSGGICALAAKVADGRIGGLLTDTPRDTDARLAACGGTSLRRRNVAGGTWAAYTR